MLHHVRARRPSFNFQLARVAATARLVRRRRVSSPTARLPRRIDKDNSGTLEKPEIVRAVKEDKKVIDFLKNCGEENLQFLLPPPRLDKALDALDTDKSGELDIEECTARRLFVSARFALFDRAPTTQGKPPSTAASRSAWSSWPTSASAASAPRRGPTPNSR